MRRVPRGRREQYRRLTAYLTDERVPAQERGWIILALAGHAVIYLILTAAESIWVIGTVMRVWRRREAGLAEAVRAGVRRPTTVILLGAHLLYMALRGLGLAGLGRRVAEHYAPGHPPT
jgi:hypothetical protein